MSEQPAARPVVVVVGAGITGLAAARAVRQARPDVVVVVLEAAGSVGGKLAVSDVAGTPVDAGAESMLARHPAGVALARAVGLSLEAPATTAASLWSRGEPRPLPTGTLLGIPTDPDVLAAAGVVSDATVRTVREEPEEPGAPLLSGPDDDRSVGELVASRFGAEVVDRIVDPLLGGVYAGHARALSLRATIPALHAAAVGERSLLAAARAVRSAAVVSDGPVFVTVAGGMGLLPVALAAEEKVRTGVTVRALHRLPAGRWRVETGPVPAPEFLDADAVVLAVPAAPASRLLAPHAPEAARRLAEVEYASVALVTLALPSTVTLPAGSGMLVPAVEGLSVKALTFYSAKWAWARRPGLTLVRLSLGRHRETAVLQRDDDDLVALARADLMTLTGVRAVPVGTRVTRWGGGLPQYGVGHLDVVAQVRTAVVALPGVAVAGAAYDGVGIPACIASGQRAAAAVLTALSAPVRP